MDQKKMLNLTGIIEPLSSSDENQLKGGFGTVGTIGISPLAENNKCSPSNTNCDGNDDNKNTGCTPTNINCVCSCGTNEPSTDEPTDDTTDDTTDDIIPTDDR